jgi:hypothetical protein
MATPTDPAICLAVLYPTMPDNILSTKPNETSAVILLSTPSGKSLLWAGDTRMETVASTASSKNPVCMLGPHHGAPEDRQNPEFPKWFGAVAPARVIASVGTGNRYDHPCFSYIKHAIRGGASFSCTQLTKQCEKPGRLRHVLKSAALLGLPQALTGYSCRGTIRLTYRGNTFEPDPAHETAHREGIKKLSQARCIKPLSGRPSHATATTAST